jgi:isoleucyl-tRNA synthetase
MSKSVGNVIAPKKVIDKYGAEILRLWVAAADYRDDIRISDNILKQLSDAYRRIRNTSRFILGNLYDFNPENDGTAYESMPEIDRFALHRLQELIQKTRKAYETYEFHIVYHALYNYCTVDLSAFYLDVLKDRLYTSPPASLARRSAQTVMHIVLDAMARLMAPILSFTSEEIWRHMPKSSRQAENVHLADLPTYSGEWRDTDLAARWELLLEVRGEVTKALEAARNQKMIGHPLDAAVTLSVGRELYAALSPYADELRAIFIVSQTALTREAPEADAYVSETMEDLKIMVGSARGDKCERCWMHEPSVGLGHEHPSLCRRCTDAIAEIGTV